MTLLGNRRAALGFIFVTAVLDVLSLGIIIPVLPKLVEGFMGGDTARAAVIYGWFGTAWALMQFLFSPLIGALSDRFGRRPVLLLSCFGLGLDYILMALAPSLSWLFLGRVLSGITAASFSTAGAYVADVTPPDKRAGAFGLIGGAWGLGFIAGPALGGWLGEISARAPFWGAAALTLTNAAYGFFVLPESLAPERRGAFSLARANPLGALKLLREYPGLFGLAGVNLFQQTAHYVLPSTMVLYSGYRYGWGTAKVGTLLALVGVCNVIVQVGLVKRMVARVGERPAMLGALLAGALGFVIYGLAPNGWWFCIGVPVFSLMGFFNPALQGLMTRRVGPAVQGRLQGANSSLLGIAGMMGPFFFTHAFAWGISPGMGWRLPGAPFFLAATLLLLGLGLALRVTQTASPRSAIA